MKTSSIFSKLALLASITLAAVGARAEDIDIYGGIAAGGGVPNILFVVDSRASNDASVSPYTCSYAPLSNGKMLDMTQCALYMAINNITSQPALSGKVSMAIMVAGPRWYFPSSPPPYGFTLMDSAGVSAITNVLANNGIKTSGNGSLGDEMYEAWAFYTGHRGPLGVTYSSSQVGTLSCQKTFIIIVGNVDDKHSNPSNSAGGSVSDLNNAIPTPTATQKTQINTSSIGPNTGEDSSSIDEWARYLYQTDFNNNANDRQSVVTYTIGTYGQGIWADKAQQMQSAANRGGGKAFLVNNLGAFTTVLNQIFNEIAAVNSVFASPGLPVTANAQGTYLNQIFVGMFRPDAAAAPRWYGNLKQYQFGVTNGANGASLFLADATGTAALAAQGTGTGFLSPNATSFWSVKDTTKLPDSIGGFWVNNPQGTGNGFDVPDGQFVEKGGVGQQIRLANLTDNYATNPTGPRNLYTCVGVGCSSSAALSTMPFSTTNTSLNSAALGITNPVSNIGVTSVSRNTSTNQVTLTLAGTPSPAIGDPTTISLTGSTGGQYDGSLAGTAPSTSGTTVTYTMNAELPPISVAVPANWTATGSVAGSTTVSSLTRTSNAGLITVTATLGDPTFGGGAANTVAVGQVVNISDTPARCTTYGYCGSGTVVSVAGNNITYTMSETPSVYGGGGTANLGNTSNCVTKNKKGNCGTITASSTNLPSAGQANLPGLVRGKNASLTPNNVLMVNFGGGATFDGGTLPAKGMSAFVAGATASAYNGAFPIVAVGASCSVTETHTDGTTRTYAGTNTSGTTVYTLCLDLGAAFAITPPASGNGAMSSTTASKQNGGATRTISSLSRGASNCPTSATATVTATTSTPHGFSNGETITVSSSSPGTGEGGYIQTPTITVLSPTQFTYTVATTPTCTDSKAGMSISYQQSSGGINVTSLIKWVRGEDNAGDEASPGNGITTRGSVHGDVIHSSPLAVNYGGSTGVVVFYGANDGVFRAINGNQPPAANTSPKPLGSCAVSTDCSIGGTPPGGELWGFIPTEFYPKLQRLYSNSPEVKLATTLTGVTPTPAPKDYFFDGPIGLYQDIANNKTYIYLSARRGGRVIYALDVSDPTAPKFLWKRTNADAGFGELGQTWSQPKVALVHGNTNPVLIFGAGYDPNEDNEPPSADTMGRGIFIVDAFTGTLLWRAGPGGGTNTCTGTPCTLLDMTYAVPADITLVDRNYDHYIDRLYAADTGGNIWRVDLEPHASNDGPAYWQVTKLASLGGTGTTKRKLLYGPDIVFATTFDAVLAGTGDREHPLMSQDANSIVNRFYMIKDKNKGMNGAAVDGSSNLIQPTVVDNSSSTTAAAPTPSGVLFDATTTAYNDSGSGFYMTLNQNINGTGGSYVGEKVVNAPTSVGGYTYFATNQPTAPNANSCTANLGIARGYRVSFLTGDSGFTTFEGGGLAPTAVYGLVTVKVAGKDTTLPFLLGGGAGGDQSCAGPDCTSNLGGQRIRVNPLANPRRTYWYRDLDR